MDLLEAIQSLISNVGFPIACVVAMFYAQSKEREQHKEESAEWVNAINRNTIILEKLMTKLDMEDARNDQRAN